MKRAGQSAGGKPLVAGAGTAPPPASQGRLLPLSRLGKLEVDKATAAGPHRIKERGANKPAAQLDGHLESSADRVRVHAPPSPAGSEDTQKTNAPQPEREAEKEAGISTVSTKNIHTSSKTRQLRAAKKYVIEREQKRINGFDIPKHKLYTFSEDTSAEFVGLRRIDAQALALLRLGDGIAVLPVDDAAAQRLKRLPRGQTVTVTAAGTVKRKGRSR